jgi:hypothetical protein
MHGLKLHLHLLHLHGMLHLLEGHGLLQGLRRHGTCTMAGCCHGHHSSSGRTRRCGLGACRRGHLGGHYVRWRDSSKGLQGWLGSPHL